MPVNSVINDHPPVSETLKIVPIFAAPPSAVTPYNVSPATTKAPTGPAPRAAPVVPVKCTNVVIVPFLDI
jgi:hypothetical protein